MLGWAAGNGQQTAHNSNRPGAPACALGSYWNSGVLAYTAVVQMTPHGCKVGKIVLFGSGETSAGGRAVHDRLMSELTPPVTVAILETPAGFEPNSEYVAGQVADFIIARLRNYNPQVHVIPARKKGTLFSPDDPRILEPLLDANYIFLGPGSPTYAVRNLEGTLALKYILGRHQEGATLCFASAATLAVGAVVLPVYEIFKAGSDLYWADGLNIFGLFGLHLAVVPHWNNTEGGAHLDTSRCFMGGERFEELKRLLPAHTVVLGIDEHTAVVFDFQQGEGVVLGQGMITVATHTDETAWPAGRSFSLSELGAYQMPATFPSFDLPTRTLKTQSQLTTLPPEVAHLMDVREEARRAKDWARADALREQLADLGFEIEDMPEGPRLRRTRAD